MKTKAELAEYINTMNTAEFIDLEAMLVRITYSQYVGSTDLKIFKDVFGVNQYGTDDD